jgi:hypothetical protein
MKIVYAFLGLAVLLGLVSTWYLNFPKAVVEVPEVESNEVVTHPLINLTSISNNGVVNSPLVLEGSARGYWFFEGSFPVVLTNWDGLIIAEGYATAVGDWMTEEFVPFKGELKYVSPYEVGDPDFMKRGTLILKKDNPSGLPEHDDAHEVTVYFAE